MNDFNAASSYAVPCIFPLKPPSGREPLSPDASEAAGYEHDQPFLQVRVPGSKSITNRAMLLAVLADGVSTLRGALFSDDTRHFLQCVRDLGFSVLADETASLIQITGCGGSLPKEEASLYVGSAGTAARFLTALLGASHGRYRLDSSEQMRRRPMAPLLASLQEMGAELTFQGQEGFFPFTITGHGFRKRHLTVDIGQSSQFLSALLIAAACSPEDILLDTAGRHGMSYIAVTTRMMKQFGVSVKASQNTYLVPGGQTYRPRDYSIEPDVSAACYFYAMAPLLGLSVRVDGVRLSSMQGDIRFLHLLSEMGCELTDTEQGLILTGPPDGRYRGITADMSACSDQAITLAALAPFAQTPTTITGIGHIRYQESDRIAAVAAELARMGVPCQEEADRITIWPGSPGPARIRTYDDHRMAMGFSLIGLRAPGIVIDNPGCCRKTFETYFDVLNGAVKQLLS